MPATDETGGGAPLEEWMEFAESEPPSHPRTRLHVLSMTAIVLAVAVLTGLVLLRPTGDARARAQEQLSVLGVPSQLYAARVASAVVGPCEQAPEIECVAVGFDITQGPDEGEVFRQAFPTGGTTPEFAEGDEVVLSYAPPDGTVAAAQVVPCIANPDANCVSVAILLDEGPAAGELAIYEAEATDPAALLIAGQPAVVTYFEDEAGRPVVVAAGPSDVQVQYQFADFQRRPVLLWVTLLFAAVVIALGRLRGAAALAGLVASLGVVLLFVLPAILDGRSPLGVAVVGAAAIAFVALYLAHGFTLMTTVALIGTLAALGLTAALSSIVVVLADFSGFVTEESTLLTLFDTIDVRGLLLAGIVLGAAGAIDDVTVTQASAVAELKASNPALRFPQLFRSGLRIGRDHIASTVNTLLLAYAGASLPLLVLFVVSEQSLGAIANSEVVAVEIVRTLVGSVGLVAAVPFTTWLAARFADDVAEGHAASHGVRAP